MFPDTRTKPLSVRDTSAREGSFKLPNSGQSLRGLRLEQRQRSREARGAEPREPETLVVTSGTGECDRVRIGKASGALSASH